MSSWIEQDFHRGLVLIWHTCTLGKFSRHPHRTERTLTPAVSEWTLCSALTSSTFTQRRVWGSALIFTARPIKGPLFLWPSLGHRALSLAATLVLIPGFPSPRNSKQENRGTKTLKYDEYFCPFIAIYTVTVGASMKQITLTVRYSSYLHVTEKPQCVNSSLLKRWEM